MTAASTTTRVRGRPVSLHAEPGNLVLDAWVRTERPREYVVLETHRDRAAVEAHPATPHSVEPNRALTPFVEGGRSTPSWITPVAPASADPSG